MPVKNYIQLLIIKTQYNRRSRSSFVVPQSLRQRFHLFSCVSISKVPHEHRMTATALVITPMSQVKRRRKGENRKVMLPAELAPLRKVFWKYYSAMSTSISLGIMVARKAGSTGSQRVKAGFSSVLCFLGVHSGTQAERARVPREYPERGARRNTRGLLRFGLNCHIITSAHIPLARASAVGRPKPRDSDVLSPGGDCGPGVGAGGEELPLYSLFSTPSHTSLPFLHRTFHYSKLPN